MDMNSHGADIYTASRNTGIDEESIIDFSSNINPLGIPDSVQRVIIDSVKSIARYPDINSRELIRRLSIHEKIPGEWIFCSNGAAEAIFRIAVSLKPKRALITSPTFSEYEHALKIVGCNVDYYNLKEENNFKIDADIIEDITIKTDIVFICNPNNPTGQLTDKLLLERIISRCKETDTTVVIDECFIDFVENKEKYSVNNLLNKYDNLIILKAFTKIYAIPGVRLGYCICSDIAKIEDLKFSGPPWNVSTIAQAVGLKALDEEKYVEESVKYVTEQRKYLVGELKKLNIKTYESYANYIFIKLSKDIDLKRELLENGILIRSCSNYRNLSLGYYRIAVKSEYDNKLLIAKLQEIMGKR